MLPPEPRAHPTARGAPFGGPKGAAGFSRCLQVSPKGAARGSPGSARPSRPHISPCWGSEPPAAWCLNAWLPAPCLSRAERGLCSGFFFWGRERTRGGRKAPLGAGEGPAVATTTPFVPVGWQLAVSPHPASVSLPFPNPPVPLQARRRGSGYRFYSCMKSPCYETHPAHLAYTVNEPPTCRAAALPQPGEPRAGRDGEENKLREKRLKKATGRSSGARGGTHTHKSIPGGGSWFRGELPGCRRSQGAAVSPPPN